MNGTKVVIRLKRVDGKSKKVLLFMGVPRAYHLFLALKDDIEFCPEGMDPDTDIVLEEYRNVTVEMTPVNIIPTHMRKLDHANNVIGKPPDEKEVQEEGVRVNKYTWYNVKRHQFEQLMIDIGGFVRGNKYILFEEERPDGSILVG